MIVLLEGSPISAEELWNSVRVTIEFLVTSLTKAVLPRLLSLAGRPNFFHLRMMETTVFLETFNAAEMLCYPSPDLCLDTILSQSSTDKRVQSWFHQTRDSWFLWYESPLGLVWRTPSGLSYAFY